MEIEFSKTAVLAITSAVLLSGCLQGDSKEHSQQEMLLQQINNALNKQQIVLNDISLNERAKLANALISSPKISSIAAYLMMEAGTLVITDEIRDKVLFASKELSLEQAEQRMYQSLLANGLPLSYSVDDSQLGVKKYFIRGKWHLETKSGSEFYSSYPQTAIQLMPYERVYYPDDLCDQGYEPFAIHSLMKRSSAMATPTISIQEVPNGWQVFVKDVDFYESLKNYRILLDVRCKEID